MSVITGVDGIASPDRATKASPYRRVVTFACAVAAFAAIIIAGLVFIAWAGMPIQG